MSGKQSMKKNPTVKKKRKELDDDQTPKADIGVRTIVKKKIKEHVEVPAKGNKITIKKIKKTKKTSTTVTTVSANLLYLYYTDYPEFQFQHQFPAISAWNIKTIRLRETTELASGGFGKCAIIEEIDLQAQQDRNHLVGLVNRFESMKDEKVRLRFDILKALEVDPHSLKIKDLLNDFNEEFGGKDEVDQNHGKIDVEEDLGGKHEVEQEDIGGQNEVDNEDFENDSDEESGGHNDADEEESETPVQDANLFEIPIEFELTASQLDLAVNSCIEVEKQVEYEKSFIPKFDLDDINTEEDTNVVLKKNVGNKRAKKESASVRSPFIQRATSLSLKLTAEEAKVSNRLFALIGDPYEPIFRTASGKGVFRQHFESFLSPSWLYSSVIDIWCHFLNIDNKRKADTSPFRYFFTIGSIFSSISTASMPDCFKNTAILTSGIREDMKNEPELLDLKNVDLRLMFTLYLDSVKHKGADKIRRCIPQYLDFPWKTTDNAHDCGVF